MTGIQDLITRKQEETQANVVAWLKLQDKENKYGYVMGKVTKKEILTLQAFISYAIVSIESGKYLSDLEHGKDRKNERI